MASNESSMGVGLEYRSVLVKEIRMHSAYSRVAALTGLIGWGAGRFFISNLGLLIDFGRDTAGGKRNP